MIDWIFTAEAANFGNFLKGTSFFIIGIVSVVFLRMFKKFTEQQIEEEIYLQRKIEIEKSRQRTQHLIKIANENISKYRSEIERDCSEHDWDQ
jgi:hypothetical protein